MKKQLLCLAMFFVLYTLPALASEVPQYAMDAYESSFIFDAENVLIGAEIEPLKPYLTDNEIENLYRSDVVSSLGIAGPTTNIFIFRGYKPKSPGNCKANPRWICSLTGTLGS